MGSAYQVYQISCEANKLVLVTDIHNSHEVYHNATSQERLELLCEALNREYAFGEFDAILALGDYSLDFWVFGVGGSYLWNPPISRTKQFVENYVPKMPTDFYMIPGNHEQYGHDAWQKICGRPREYVLLYGEYVIAMLDTFGGELDPTEHSDGCYTGINAQLLSQVLEDYPDRKIILCAHDILIGKESEEARQLICKEKRILCAFAGHTHRENVRLLPDQWRNLPVFYCGNFSDCGGPQKKKNWGYRILELANGRFFTEYMRVSSTL